MLVLLVRRTSSTQRLHIQNVCSPFPSFYPSFRCPPGVSQALKVLGLESNLVFHGSLVSACEKERRGPLWPSGLEAVGWGKKHMEQVPFSNSTQCIYIYISKKVVYSWFTFKHGDFPWLYIGLPEGIWSGSKYGFIMMNHQETWAFNGEMMTNPRKLEMMKDLWWLKRHHTVDFLFILGGFWHAPFLRNYLFNVFWPLMHLWLMATPEQQRLWENSEQNNEQRIGTDAGHATIHERITRQINI